jgi:hypothetical protein
VDAAVKARIAATWKDNIPFLPGRTVDAADISRALRDDMQSFFVTGGRSFDVKDGLGDWHRVTIEPDQNHAKAEVARQTDDNAKFDTRIDQSSGTKKSATTGNTGVLGANALIPQRLGPGGGFGGEMTLSRPLESSETSARLTDSHNVRSGGYSHLVGEPVTDRYDVIVMNPPFHTGQSTDVDLGRAFLKVAAASLKRGGKLLLVANRQLPYEAVLVVSGLAWRKVAEDKTYKILFADKR